MKVIILWIGLVLAGANFIHLSAQPIATIVSADETFCESGNPVLQIRFENGEAPYGVVYEIVNLETGGKSIQKELNQDIFENDLENGIWSTSTINVGSTSEINLIEVFDNSIPAADWKYFLNDNGYGSTDVHGQMNIIINDKPQPEAGPNEDKICEFSYQLKGSLQDPTNNMLWEITSGGAGEFDFPDTPNATFTPDAPGIYTLTLNEEFGACKGADAGTDEVQLNIKGHAISVISGNVEICSNDGLDYDLLANVNFQGDGDFTYDISDGVNTIKNRTGDVGDNALPAIDAMQAAEWRVIKVADANGCESLTESMTGVATIVDRKPNASIIKTKDFNCSNSLRLEAVLDKGEGGRWLSNSLVTFTPDDQPITMATAPSYETHKLIWEETNLGCSEQASVDITFVDPPKLTLLKADTAICNGSTAMLRVSTVSAHYDLDLSYSDGTNSSIIEIKTPYSEIPLTPSGNGLAAYQLISITDAAKCSTDLSDVFNVTVNNLPTPNAGVYDPECGSSILLNAVLGENESGTWSSIYGVFTDVNDPKATFSVDESNQLVTQMFDVNWSIVNDLNNNCTAHITTQVILDKKPANVSAGKDTTIYNDDKYKYAATGLEDGMTGLWTSNTDVFFSDVNGENGTASELKMGENELTWAVSNGVCEAEPTTIVVTAKGLTNPTGFSPNGDTINDTFMIGGANKVENNKLLVFTVEGKLVYEKEEFGHDGDIGWNGVGMDGSKLKNGTYYYVFTGDGISPVKDFLVIKGNQ
ncbi:gliding motility-associated C-terminal domain-containing protein [Carboxylicivirga sp. N1Y90]|uniref:T9SS type B sorting domain-containing protein n=1 Tax=Carboxylicivirga fragile TaxID=3417571 RepID=UPI003D34AB51|nr:gliding motility-associated C-terminal domain-containing protein [Marinilabiliaceae bacterium N1Y90]